MSTWNRAVVLLVCGLASLCALPAGACDVPVFRYALQFWAPDAYRVVVFHREPLSSAQQQVVDYLQRSGVEGGGYANVTVSVVDVSGEIEPAMRALWEMSQATGGEPAGAALPRLVLAYPRGVARGGVVWAGALTMADAQAIRESAARVEIARRLLADESGVWVLVESGDGKKDEAAADLLTATLAQMPGSLTLATGTLDTLDTPEAVTSRPAPRIDFSLLRVSPSVPSERILRAMLMGSEPDLADRYAGEPMAFPVFGRGRALYALVGKGINAPNVSAACAYLVGMCSCQVKDDNPGTDLLIAADWDGLVTVEPATVPELPTVIGPGDGAAPVNTTVVVDEPIDERQRTGATDSADTGAAPGSLPRKILLAVIGIILVVVSLLVVISRRPVRS